MPSLFPLSLARLFEWDDEEGEEEASRTHMEWWKGDALVAGIPPSIFDEKDAENVHV